MECIEIILEDIPRQYLNDVMREVIRLDTCDIISSHFFDKKNNKDIEYQDIDNFENCFDDFGAGNLYIEKVKIGIILEKVMILLSYNGQIGDITINFLESQFEIDGSPILNENINEMIVKLLEAQKKYKIDNIIIGYEPATDDDMKMVEFHQGHMKIYNEELPKSLFVQTLYHALKSY